MQQQQHPVLVALKQAKKAFKYALLFSLATNVMMLALPIYSLQVLERVPASGRVETLVVLSLIALLMIVIFSLFYSIRAMMMTRTSRWIDDASSEALLDTSLQHAVSNQGVNASQPLRDLQTIRQFIGGQSLMSLFDAPWSVIYFLILYLIHPILCFITLGGGLALFIFAYLNEILTKQHLQQANESNVRAMQTVETSARNAEIIAGMGMASAIGSLYSAAQNTVLANQAIASDRGTIIQSLSRGLRMSLQIFTMGTGMYLLLQNEVTIGGVIACSILAGRALAPFEQAIGAWTQVVGARKSLSRLKSLIESTPQRIETLELPEPNGELIVEQVSYGLPTEKRAILRNIHFMLKPGESVGVIGPSAAGKSTLAKLIMGIHKPLAGAVRLDGADVYHWARSSFGKYVGFLPQDVELFDGTVRDNIARMQPNMPDEDVIAAAQAAGAHEMILGLPSGYDTYIGVGGSNLSAGQRQRVGLARAFFGNPKLVVLDEPNANLDDQGDAALMGAIAYAKQAGITLVIIAHRPSILQTVDKVLVIKDGQQIEFGDAAEVMAKFRKKGAAIDTKKMPSKKAEAKKPDTPKTEFSLSGSLSSAAKKAKDATEGSE